MHSRFRVFVPDTHGDQELQQLQTPCVGPVRGKNIRICAVGCVGQYPVPTLAFLRAYAYDRMCTRFLPGLINAKDQKSLDVEEITNVT